jgi:hypothetical protein
MMLIGFRMVLTNVHLDRSSFMKDLLPLRSETLRRDAGAV